MASIVIDRLGSSVTERLLQSAPAMEMRPQAFRQVVSWAPTERKPVILAELIASQSPSLAQELGLNIGEPVRPIKEVGQLSADELRCVVRARLEQNEGTTRLAVLGQGVFSIGDILEQIEAGTDLGHRVLEVEKQNITLLEGLVKLGKI